ncbi:MAG: tetratricopeptide repeat protein [Gemmatimonadota bacterium]
MRDTLRELVRRRVPQLAGIYLATGWAVLEFTDWAVGQFDLPDRLLTAMFVLLILLLPLVVAAAWRLGGDREGGSRTGPDPAAEGLDRGPEPVGGEQSVAVLPFANVGGVPEDEYLGDGISEEILSALSRVDGIRIVSRTSALAWKEKRGDVREIGRSLGAGSVLEGSVQRSGGRLRVTTRLVDVANGWQLWSGRFDREMRDVFEIQDEIAGNVARALRVVLREPGRASPPRTTPSDVRAYEYVLRGRQFFRETRKASLEFALEMFRKAIEVDPEYAEGYVGAASAQAILLMYYPGLGAGLEEADIASRRALELAPELADAHAARGLVLFVSGELEEAEERFREAMERDPHQFEARYFYGRICFQQGRHAKAAALYDDAVRAREDYQAAFFAAQAYEALGDVETARLRYAVALAIVETHMDLNPDDPRAATMRAVASCRLGDLAEGIRWAEKAIAIDPKDASVRYNVACLFALEGETDRAIELLEQAFASGFGQRDWVRQDPDLASLRGDPRFESLVAAQA